MGAFKKNHLDMRAELQQMMKIHWFVFKKENFEHKNIVKQRILTEIKNAVIKGKRYIL